MLAILNETDHMAVVSVHAFLQVRKIYLCCWLLHGLRDNCLSCLRVL
jgi:hypothetical protein